jgi:hypothetical protein
MGQTRVVSDVPPPPPPPGVPGYGSSQPAPPPPSSGVPGYDATPYPPGYGATPYPPGYGAAPYPPGYAGPYGATAREHPDGTTILVLGLVGLGALLFCGLITMVVSPLAWFKGSRARKEIAAQPEVQFANAGNITAGWICGIIGTCLIALGFIVLVIVLVAAGAAGS